MGRAAGSVFAGDPWDEREYEMYPPAMGFPYRLRRFDFAEQRYGALGIERDDLGPASVRPSRTGTASAHPAEGLHSCPQMAWAKVRRSVAEVVSPPDELMLFCGMSIGFEDVAVEYARTGRAPLDETVTYVG
jgi:hypothetical protein